MSYLETARLSDHPVGEKAHDEEDEQESQSGWRDHTWNPADVKIEKIIAKVSAFGSTQNS